MLTNTKSRSSEVDCGYVCKRCGKPSPMGVGFTNYEPGAYAASKRRKSCACGYSIDPRTLH